ncbi:CLUMA_CG021417, isoform A [Clunio marinus]|uniref:Tafazzin family protein n=1 Tax=Clunio marinus TaxID=568069 RepID=A0A1J1JAP1_9DIPT|nr:CLUMA_CG021417, isoform A [Clunio marinus]
MNKLRIVFFCFFITDWKRSSCNVEAMSKFKFVGNKMPYNFNWVFPRMEKPSFLFRIASQMTIGLVGFFSRLLIVCLNRTNIYNKHHLEDLMIRRPNQALLTISNHYSCFDDPAIWGCLKLRNVCNSKRMRWSMAAHDICFTNKLHSLFFMFGKCIPVVRGAGVYQPAVDLCIEKLKLGDWVHVFPEGRVNMEKEYMRLKWGVGRILFESFPVNPIIIPIWHEGMNELLPNYPPYYFRLNSKLTFNFGKPIDLSETMKMIFDKNIDEVEARRVITDEIQKNLEILRVETEQLHNKS